MRVRGLLIDVNCSILFTELPLLARPAAAKAAGFDGVEFWWPWDEMVPSDRQADAFVAALADAGVQLVSLNFHTGDMAAGERGLVSIPSAAAAFRENIAACAELAARTGCTRLNAAYGNRLDGVDPAEQDAVAIENLTLAAAAAGRPAPASWSRRSTPSTSPRSPSTPAPPRSRSSTRCPRPTSRSSRTCTTSP